MNSCYIPACIRIVSATAADAVATHIAYWNLRSKMKQEAIDWMLLYFRSETGNFQLQLSELIHFINFQLQICYTQNTLLSNDKVMSFIFQSNPFALILDFSERKKLPFDILYNNENVNRYKCTCNIFQIYNLNNYLFYIDTNYFGGKVFLLRLCIRHIKIKTNIGTNVIIILIISEGKKIVMTLTKCHSNFHVIFSEFFQFEVTLLPLSRLLFFLA